MTDVLLNLNDLVLPPPEATDGLIDGPHVVIFIDATTDRVFMMNMCKDLKPRKLSFGDLLAALEQGTLIKGKFELPDYMRLPEQFITQKQLALRDAKFAIIQPIVKNLEQYLLPTHGDGLIEECLSIAKQKSIHVNRTQIYQWIYRFFRAGSNINAFLRKPGTGKLKNEASKKTGPKRSDGVAGRKRNRKDEANIRTIVNTYIKCPSPLSYPKAFSRYEDRYASIPRVSPFTGEVVGYNRLPAEQRLTQDQFTRYATAYVNSNIDAIRAAQGKTDAYRKDSKGLKGNIEEFYAEGPGHVYQVDETPLNIELVDEFDATRQRRMGKPTCYSVIDMFSRAWVALLLSFSKASAHTAREVIFVAFRGKKNFCDEIGVTLTEPWDISGKCRMIFVDNAEFKAELERSISKDAQIEQVYNTEGNSQQKGLVERRHKTLEEFLWGLVPGAGRKKIAEYLKRRLRQDALLNIRELYQILIDFLTRYNNYYPIEGLPLTPQMRLDGVQPIAMKKFAWGLKNRPGFLKPVDESELYLNLLEVGEVTIHRDHLFLPGKYLNREVKGRSQGLQYVCEWTQKNGLQDYKKRSPTLRLSCRFMRYSVHTIFIETIEGLKPATLKNNDLLYQYMSGECVAYDKKMMASTHKNLQNTYEEKQSETRATTDRLIENARKEQVRLNRNEANTQDISANKAEAVAIEIAAAQKLFNAMTGTAPLPNNPASEASFNDANPYENQKRPDNPPSPDKTTSIQSDTRTVDTCSNTESVRVADSTAALFAAKRKARKASKRKGE